MWRTNHQPHRYREAADGKWFFEQYLIKYRHKRVIFCVKIHQFSYLWLMIKSSFWRWKDVTNNVILSKNQFVSTHEEHFWLNLLKFYQKIKYHNWLIYIIKLFFYLNFDDFYQKRYCKIFQTWYAIGHNNEVCQSFATFL